jgi:hypothetical protein
MITAVALMSFVATLTAAAPKKPVKPAPKKPAAPSVQLAGNNGVFGTVYSIKKDYPLYFKLKSAEYTTNQVSIGGTLYSPKASEKLLVLHFNIQNPMKSEQYVRWDSLSFTAVDDENNNHEGNNDWGDDEAKGHPKIGITLKPAQTISVMTVVVVPAKGSIPKLMVMPGDDNGPVLRYAMAPDKAAPAQNKPGGLTAPIADPEDSTNCTALETVPGVIGTVYPYGALDVTIEKSEYTTSKLGEYEIEDEGQRFLLITVAIKNDSPNEQFVRWDTFQPTLVSADDEELSYRDMLLANSNRPFGLTMKAGQESRARLLFSIPKDVTPKTLTMKEGDEGRSYQFSIE